MYLSVAEKLSNSQKPCNHILTEPSPTGSYVENSEELERTESEKRKIEIMREHYKDDWLKALQADQGRLSEHKTEDQSKPREVTVEVEKIEERVTVTAESKAGEAKVGEDRKESEVEIDVKQQSGRKGKYIKKQKQKN